MSEYAKLAIAKCANFGKQIIIITLENFDPEGPPERGLSRKLDFVCKLMVWSNYRVPRHFWVGKSGFSCRASDFVIVALNTPRRGFNAILTGRAVKNCNVCIGIRW